MTPLFAKNKQYIIYALILAVLLHIALISALTWWWPHQSTAVIPVTLSLQTIIVKPSLSPLAQSRDFKPTSPKPQKLSPPGQNIKRKEVVSQIPLAPQAQPRDLKPASSKPQKRSPPDRDDTKKESAAQTKPESPVIYIAPTPLAAQNQPPVYPARAKQRGLEGKVLVNATIDKAGLVSNLSIKKSSGHKLFDQAAIKAISKWKFNAGSTNTIKQSSEIEIPIRFQLN